METPEYIRANPSFHHQPRYDTVLAQMPNGVHVFARIHLFFQCQACGKTWNIALVTLFKTLESPDDSRIRLRLVREDVDSSFLDVNWIIRRVFLCKLYGSVHEWVNASERDFWVNDLIANDADMYLRLQGIEPCM